MYANRWYGVIMVRHGSGFQPPTEPSGKGVDKRYRFWQDGNQVKWEHGEAASTTMLGSKAHYRRLTSWKGSGNMGTIAVTKRSRIALDTPLPRR